MKHYFEGSSDFYGDVMGIENEYGDRIVAEFHYDEEFDMDEFINIEECKEQLADELYLEEDPEDCNSYYDLTFEEQQYLLTIAKGDFSDVEFAMPQEEEEKILAKRIIDEVKELISNGDENWNLEDVKEELGID